MHTHYWGGGGQTSLNPNSDGTQDGDSQQGVLENTAYIGESVKEICRKRKYTWYVISKQLQ